MSFWSDPVGSIQGTVNTLSNDASNIGNALTSVVTDPSINNIKKVTAQTLANPGASAVAGAALVAAGLPPNLAALAVGGTDALATGSISKGIGAGIGAYGGASLGTAAIDAGQAATIAETGTGQLSPAASSFTQNLSNMATGIANPSGLLAASSPGGIGADSLALAGNVLKAANGPNGNAILSGIAGAATPSTGIGTAAGPAGSTATVGGNPSGQYYNRNPIAGNNLNLIGSQYIPGETPDTSERTYFTPTYSTTQGPTPVNLGAGSPTTYTAPATAVPNQTQASPSSSTQSAGIAATPNIDPALLQKYQQLTSTAKNGGVMRAAMGGLQNTPQAMMVNQTNPSAPMSYNLEDAYHRPYGQTPTPQPVMNMAEGGLDHHAHMAARKSIAEDEAKGYNLGGYSDGGRLLKGPGDGVSDSIPATIGHKQPARLADGEFVVPARHVSELGNGSTEAGARKLYAMLDRIQSARAKTVGKKKGSIDSKADKYLPA